MINRETGARAASMEAVAVQLDTRLRQSVAFSDTVRAAILSRFPAAAALPSKEREGSSQGAAVRSDQ